jgi:hypothetical protein
MNPWVIGQALGFQLLWLIAVLGQNQLIPVLLLFIGLHFWWSPEAREDLCLLPLALVGLAGDGLLIAFNVLAFEQTPYWLVGLWTGFVLTLGHSLAWLGRLPLVARLGIGASAGALSYVAGWRMGAVHFPQPFGLTVAWLWLHWAVLIPLLFWLSEKSRGMSCIYLLRSR